MECNRAHKKIPLGTWFVFVVIILAGSRTGCFYPDSPAPRGNEVVAVSEPFSLLDAGEDRSDQECRVVLRTARRPLNYWGGYETLCNQTGCWRVLQVQVDVSRDLLENGGVPALLYRSGSDPTWWETRGSSPADGEVPAGSTRLEFRIGEHGMAEEYGYPAVLEQSVELIPIVHLPGGGRLFDHNRLPGPFDNYLLDAANSWTLLDESGVCWGEQGRTVRLIEAQVATVVSGQGRIPDLDTVLWGTVATRVSQDPDERVRIHYQIRRGDQVERDWTWADARQAGEGNWEFTIPSHPTYCPHYCYGILYQFAIEYTADGETHWDNFAGYGTDYALSTDFGGMAPVFRAPVAHLDSALKLSWAKRENDVFSGEVLLRNLAYQKEVTVVYTTDDWLTEHEAQGWFQHKPMSPEFEYWRFSAPVDGQSSRIRFAVRYRTDDRTYWDNNHGQDYLLESDQGDLVTVPAI
jgi:hypothetical protein